MAGYTKKEMIKACYYYYKKQLTQFEISKKMKMSRQRVNRILKRSIEEGIVEIKIEQSKESFVELENQIEEIFKIKQCFVTYQGLKFEESAAKFLEKLVVSENLVGVTCGKTLSSVCNYLDVNKNFKISVVQLVGGMNIKHTSLQADQITRLMASKWGGVAHVLYAPVLLQSKEIKEALMLDNMIKNIFDNMSKCTYLIVGIGELSEKNSIYEDEIIDKEYKNELLKLNAVGDIGFRWYDKNGDRVKHSYDEKTLSYDVLKKSKNQSVIAIARGVSKLKSIYSALIGNHIDILITDENTAELLKNYGGEK